MVGEFKTVRKGHEMTNRKMFFTMLWGAVFRRRSRAVMAVIASMVALPRCSALRRRVLPFHSR